MQTIMTIAQQKEWLNKNWQYSTLVHKWSTNGYGNSKILANGDVIGKADGCGYDRYGAALGNAIMEMFPKELHKLAKRHCVGKRRNYKQPKNSRLYGLFYDAIKDRAWVDGACGSNQMIYILNAIGFGLDYVRESKRSHTGKQFYTMRPVSKNERKWLSR